MELIFERAETQEEFKEILNYTLDVFSDSPDFKWNLEDMKKEVAEGWELYGVRLGAEIITAVLLKQEKNSLLSKNTSLKSEHQGSGHSHRIKEFIEEEAISRKVSDIIHYCRIDNFRMYSLNQSHGYEQINKDKDDGSQIIEWQKKIEK